MSKWLWEVRIKDLRELDEPTAAGANVLNIIGSDVIEVACKVRPRYPGYIIVQIKMLVRVEDV